MTVLRRLSGGDACLATTNTKAWQWSRVLCLLLVNAWAIIPSADAQVTADGTLSTTVTSSDSQNFTIENGDRTGNNLFHSFSEFSIPTNGSAIFNTPTDLETIFSRVTGANVSNIDGLIQANGTANLFLLNPNGILFGENASLDIGGSFLATTADSILFNDNIEFSAAEAAPLLTISTPIGLQFNANPSPITVVGPGHNLTLDSDTFAPAPIRDNRPVGLQVNTGETLALIGGDILIAGGNLTASQGRIGLGSVAQAGTVSLSPTTDGFALEYGTLDRFGDLRFTQAASVEVSGEGSGNLHFQGRNISVLDASAIISNVLGADAGGEVRVRASESIDIIGSQTEEFPSAFFNQGELGSTGNVGNLSLETERFQLDNGAFISNSIAGTGNGGDLIITANDVSLMGEPFHSSTYSTGLFAEIFDTDERGSADRTAGTIDLTVETLRVADGSLIATGVFGPGNGGSIKIQAQAIELIGVTTSDIFPSSIVGSTFADGNAGNIDIQTSTLRAVDGSQISNSTFAQGNGGSITIQANEIDLIGINSINKTPSSIVASTRSSGNSGTIDVQANRLRVVDGAQIFTGTSGQGAGGSITIQANEIELTGETPSGRLVPSLIFAAAVVDGDAGTIDIKADRLRVTEGGQISNGSFFGSGDGGSIKIQASEIELTGESPSEQFSSGIFASTRTDGKAGTIDIDVDTLRVTEGGAISNSTFDQGTGGAITIQANEIELVGVRQSDGDPSGIFTATRSGADGNGGMIDLQVDTRLRITAGAQITASTAGAGNAGDIRLQANELDVRGFSDIRQLNSQMNSQITTLSETAAAAGSINIEVETLRVADQGLISVSSLGQGDAGNLTIIADQIQLTDSGSLQAEVVAGSQGNILLMADSLLFMRRGALISTNAANEATGGNITIEAPVVLGLNNSDIVANAVQGDGGKITITTQALMGLEFRDFRTPDNDITASSEFGLDGIVQINTPGLYPSQGTVELPNNLTDPSNQISTNCLVATDNSFTLSGRGGLPDNPRNLGSSSVWEDLRPLETGSNVNSETLSTPDSYTPPIEATDMRITTNGQVEFVASTAGQPSATIELVSCRSRANL